MLVITEKDAMVIGEIVRIFLRELSTGGPLPRIFKIPKK
jgi:hypothetical protein